MGQDTEQGLSTGRFSPIKAERFYFWSVLVLGLVVFAYTCRTTHVFWAVNGWDFLVFALLSILAEQTYVTLPHGSKISASFSVLLTGLLLFNAPVVIVLAALGNFYTILIVQRRGWDIAFFNMAQYAITYGAAGAALMAADARMGMVLSELPLLHMMVSAGAATVTYLLINIPLVNGFVAIKSQIGLTWQKWFKSLLVFQEDKVEITQTLFFFPIAVMVASFYQRDHNLVILGVLMALILGGLKFIDQRRSMEEQNDKLRTLYEINKELGEFILHEAEVEITQKDLFHNLLKQRNYQQIARVISNQRCSIYRVEHLGEDWRIVHEVSDHIPEPEKNFHMEDEGPLQDMVHSKQGVITNHLGHLPLPYVLWKKAYKAFIAQPILLDDTVAYIMVIFREHMEPFSERDERMLKLLIKPMEITLKNIQLRMKIQEQAIKDGLMGVFNHRYLKNKMEEELNRSKRYKKLLSLIICDVDYFKKFNDTHGHLLGDRVLKEIAGILQDSVRETDIVARYGGEELGILLPETPLGAACEVAERIRRNVASYPFVGKDNQTVSLSMSMGVTCTDDDPNLQVSELIVRADTALYKAKNQGRNQICQAEVEEGKLIIETYSRGASPRPADAVVVLPADLRPETRQIWLEALDKDAPLLLATLTEFIQAQPDLKPVYQTYFLNKILPQLPELFRSYVQTPRTASGPHAWGEAVQQALQLWKQRLQNKLQHQSHVLLLNELCLQAYRHFVEQALALPMAEPEKKFIFEICYAFFKEVSMVLLQSSCTYLEEQRTQSMHLLEAVRGLNQFQTGLLGEEELLEHVLNEIQAVVSQAEGLLISFPDLNSGQFLTRGFRGLLPRAVAALQNQLSFRWPLPGYSAWQLVESQSPELWGTARASLEEHLPGLQAAIFRPVSHERDVKALIVLLFNQPLPLSNRQLRWLETFSDEFAIALAGQRQTLQLEQRIVKVLKQMIDIFESGASPWRFHSERVSSLAGRLAFKLSLLPHEQQQVRELAYLHKIGQLVSLPAGQNNLNETWQDQQHVLLGGRILEMVPHLRPLAPAIRHFAEHWDGSGFPDGLAGPQIPLYARIIGLANAYESQLQAGHSIAEAVESLLKTGYYDPSLCTLLKDMVEADEVKI
ncbi:MAG: diguanylate cyclase [Candidatus Sericytochromatia bacterium]|nr:diguanylate cyclase [Candidatus Sericytochromatia bacterium]